LLALFAGSALAAKIPLIKKDLSMQNLFAAKERYESMNHKYL
jgi:hypothetical protein